jgi:hypothetical protein
MACRYVDEVVRNAYGQDNKPTIDAVHSDLIMIDVNRAARDYPTPMSLMNQWLPTRTSARSMSPILCRRPTPAIRERLLETG